MFDLHAHILPGIDDGPKTWEDALAMVKAAAGDGIAGIAATPHVKHGMSVTEKERVLELAAELAARIAEALPDSSIKIFPGSEISVSAESLSGLREGRFCTLNSGRYVLIELPPVFATGSVISFLDAAAGLGLIPVIAHPERNQRILSGPEPLYAFAEKGALMQVTAGSFTGFFGSEVKSLAFGLLERNLVHIVASDAHSPKHRPPALSGARRAVSKAYGEELAREIFIGNPVKIIESEPIVPLPPVRPKNPAVFVFNPASLDF